MIDSKKEIAQDFFASIQTYLQLHDKFINALSNISGLGVQEKAVMIEYFSSLHFLIRVLIQDVYSKNFYFMK
ncbi:MAG: hypothetical protein ACUVQP_08535 [Bacteroidales bacterium]